MPPTPPPKSSAPSRRNQKRKRNGGEEKEGVELHQQDRGELRGEQPVPGMTLWRRALARGKPPKDPRRGALEELRAALKPWSMPSRRLAAGPRRRCSAPCHDTDDPGTHVAVLLRPQPRG
jgi:hypothetical protein